MLAGLIFAGALLQGGPTLTLDAVGDVMLGRHIALRLENRRPVDAFEGVRSELFHADLVVGNLECALTSRPFLMQKANLLRGPIGFASQLKGFAALSLMNNHAGDCGPAGLADTRRALHGVSVAGIEDRPTFIERNGIRLGFVGICDLPGYRHPGWEAAVKQAVAGSDVGVVMVHWGIEGSPLPSAAQRALARKLYSLGVKLILGAHPHVLQPSFQLGPDGFVAYSLGNFVFDVPFLKSYASQRQSEILRLVLDKHGVRSVKHIPVWLKHGFPQLNRSK